MVQKLPSACVIDLTAPTFAGIATAVPHTDGTIKATWALGTDSTPPIEYLVYIALGSVSAATLFQSTNLYAIAPSGSTSLDVYKLGDNVTYLIKDLTYTLGVRAKDGVGNIETNVAVLTAVATGSGNLPQVLSSAATVLDSVVDALVAAGGVDVEIETPQLDLEIQSDEEDL